MKATIKLSELLKKLSVKSKKHNTQTLPSSETFDVKVDYANSNDQTKQQAVKDDGGSEERQTWDSPMEFLMSCKVESAEFVRMSPCRPWRSLGTPEQIMAIHGNLMAGST